MLLAWCLQIFSLLLLVLNISGRAVNLGRANGESDSTRISIPYVEQDDGMVHNKRASLMEEHRVREEEELRNDQSIGGEGRLRALMPQGRQSETEGHPVVEKETRTLLPIPEVMRNVAPEEKRIADEGNIPERQLQPLKSEQVHLFQEAAHSEVDHRFERLHQEERIRATTVSNDVLSQSSLLPVQPVTLLISTTVVPETTSSSVTTTSSVSREVEEVKTPQTGQGQMTNSFASIRDSNQVERKMKIVKPSTVKIEDPAEEDDMLHEVGEFEADDHDLMMTITTTSTTTTSTTSSTLPSDLSTATSEATLVNSEVTPTSELPMATVIDPLLPEKFAEQHFEEKHPLDVDTVNSFETGPAALEKEEVPAIPTVEIHIDLPTEEYGHLLYTEAPASSTTTGTYLPLLTEAPVGTLIRKNDSDEEEQSSTTRTHIRKKEKPLGRKAKYYPKDAYFMDDTAAGSYAYESTTDAPVEVPQPSPTNLEGHHSDIENMQPMVPQVQESENVLATTKASPGLTEEDEIFLEEKLTQILWFMCSVTEIAKYEPSTWLQIIYGVQCMFRDCRNAMPGYVTTPMPVGNGTYIIRKARSITEPKWRCQCDIEEFKRLYLAT